MHLSNWQDPNRAPSVNISRTRRGVHQCVDDDRNGVARLGGWMGRRASRASPVSGCPSLAQQAASPHRQAAGAKPGNQQTLKHGLWSAKFVAHRAVVTTALREARRLARDLAAD
jgi:hypothetical protein